MTLPLAVFLLFLHRGVLGDLPPCFTNQTTWYSDDMEDAVQNIETPFICQELCAVSNCKGFTWYSEHSQHFPKLCALYHTLETEQLCNDCVSGPVSCTCSGSFGCDITSDNVIDIITSTESETKCQNICFNTPGCTFYTYYNYLNIMKDFCYILNSCDQTDDTCHGCFSGPSTCSSSTSSTTTFSTATSTTITTTTTTVTSTTTTTTTATATTSTPTTTNHNPCLDMSYKILDDETRNVNHGSYEYCDNDLYTSPDWEGPGWYRFKSPAGTQIPESPPDPLHCNTEAPGWLDGKHPQTLFEEITATVCFNYSGEHCWGSKEISVINCGEYYLYNLLDVPYCKLRYCGV